MMTFRKTLDKQMTGRCNGTAVLKTPKITAGQHLPCTSLDHSMGLCWLMKVGAPLPSLTHHTYTHGSLGSLLASVLAKSTKKESGEGWRLHQERERLQCYKEKEKKGHRAGSRNVKQVGLQRGCCTAGGTRMQCG